MKKLNKLFLASTAVLLLNANVVNAQPTFGGRLHLEDSYKTVNSRNGDISTNKFTMKRARLNASDNINDKLSYYIGLQADGGSTVNLDEAYIGYKISDNLSVRAGQFIPLVGIFSDQSSNHKPFNKSLAGSDIEFFGNGDTDRATGIAIENLSNKKYGFQVGFFGNSSSHYESVKADQTYRGTTRAWISPINTDNSVLHLGLGASYENYTFNDSDSDNTESGDKLRGTIDLAYQYKFLTLSTSYVKTSVDKTLESYDSDIFSASAVNAEVVVNLTGQKTSYSGGYFGRTSPNNLDVVQLGFRYSKLTDDDKTATLNRGKEQYAVSVAYVPNKNLKFVLDRTEVQPKKGNKSVEYVLSTRFMF